MANDQRLLMLAETLERLEHDRTSCFSPAMVRTSIPHITRFPESLEPVEAFNMSVYHGRCRRKTVGCIVGTTITLFPAEAHMAYTDLKETVHRLDERFLYGHVTDGKSHRPYVRPEQVAARLLELEVQVAWPFFRASGWTQDLLDIEPGTAATAVRLLLRPETRHEPWRLLQGASGPAAPSEGTIGTPECG